MKPRTINLADDERIIAVVPSHHAGPGWANAVAWVHIVDRGGHHREEAIQPDERTREMTALFAAGAAMHAALMDAVPSMNNDKSKPGRPALPPGPAARRGQDSPR